MTPIEPVSDTAIAVLIAESRNGADEHGGMGHEYDSGLFDRLGDALEQMQSRLRSAEADAKRYRWLRDPERMPADDPHGHLIVGEADGEDIHWRESLDNAIDRAMEHTP